MPILIFNTDCRNRVKFSARDLQEMLWIMCKFPENKAGKGVIFLFVKIKLYLRVYGKSV